jgi:MFS family permease
MSTITMENAAEAIELQPPSKTSAPVLIASDSNGPGTPISSNGDRSSNTKYTSKSHPSKSNLRTFLAIFTPSFVGFIASFTSGIITVGLPEIARSLALERSLYLWPSSVYGLTSGATLLIAGSIADIVGARPVELLGITLLGIFTLACGFSTTGEQLVVFRALQGVALGMHLPASVSLISGAVPSGRARNFGFACLGFSQPLGFASGLVLSGVMIQRAGWRSGFYVSGGTTLAVALAAVWTLPKLKTGSKNDNVRTLGQRIVKEIDWVGGIISSGGLAILAYVLA